MLDRLSTSSMHLLLVQILLVGCLVPSHAEMVFKTASNETVSVTSADGLIWTDVTPVKMLPVIDVTADKALFDFCDSNWCVRHAFRWAVSIVHAFSLGCVYLLLFPFSNDVIWNIVTMRTSLSITSLCRVR